MAEFCKGCAKKYHLKYDRMFPGEICEGCGKIIEKKLNFLKRVFRLIKSKK